MAGGNGQRNRLSEVQKTHVDQILTNYMQQPLLAVKAREKIQEFMTSGDFPSQALDILKQFNKGATYDSGYESVFDLRDYTGTDKSGFAISDVEDGLVFKQMEEGEKVKLFQAKGVRTTVDFLDFAGGLGWSRKLIDDKDYWTLEDNARTFRNKYWHDKAERHYALIDAIGAGQNLAWQAVTPSGVANTNDKYDAIRDSNTLQKAAENLLSDNSTKGYENMGSEGMNAEFVVLIPHVLWKRINNALNLYLQSFNQSPNQVTYNFRVVPTTMLSDVTKYYVCIPGNKTISATRQNPTMFSEFDMMSYTDAAVVWSRYVGVIGDTELFQRCATS